MDARSVRVACAALALASGCQLLMPNTEGGGRPAIVAAGQSPSPTEPAATPTPDPGPAGPTPGPEFTLRPTPTPVAPVPGVKIFAPAVSPQVFLPGSGDGEDTLPTSIQLSAIWTHVDLSTSSVVTWTTSDDTIATVDASGSVKAATKAGEALITATSEDKTASASVTVKVRDGTNAIVGVD